MVKNKTTSLLAIILANAVILIGMHDQNKALITRTIEESFKEMSDTESRYARDLEQNNIKDLSEILSAIPNE